MGRSVRVLKTPEDMAELERLVAQVQEEVKSLTDTIPNYIPGRTDNNSYINYGVEDF